MEYSDVRHGEPVRLPAPTIPGSEDDHDSLRCCFGSLEEVEQVAAAADAVSTAEIHKSDHHEPLQPPVLVCPWADDDSDSLQDVFRSLDEETDRVHQTRTAETVIHDPEDTDEVSTAPTADEGHDADADGNADGNADDQGNASNPAPRTAARESLKCIVLDSIVLLIFIGGFAFIAIANRNFQAPVCLNDRPQVNSPHLCEPCGSGTVVFPFGGEYEQTWPFGLRACLYFLGLVWCFLGVAVVCDIFMLAIEQITSQVKIVWKDNDNGCQEVSYDVVWNATVANLSLMALGSSAPEILLNVYEMVHPSTAFYSGDLGVSTIVGSAAFNLFVITAVCVSAIPVPDTRKVQQTDVFFVTATSSLFAYLWIVYVLSVSTPDKVDVWEAALTFAFTPTLIITAYAADKEVFVQLLPCRRKDASSLYKTRASTTKATVRRSLMHSALASGSGSSNFLGSSNSDLSQASKGDPRILTIGFKRRATVVSETREEVVLPVIANRKLEFPVHIAYRTFDEQAKQDVHYQAVEGILKFMPDDIEHEITVPLLRHRGGRVNRVQGFSVELARHESIAKQARRSRQKSGRSSGASECSRTSVEFPSGKTSLRSCESDDAKSPNSFATIKMGISRAKVFILKDSEPGCLSFDFYRVVASRDTDKIAVVVNRTQGTAGRITCKYRTVPATATSDIDYAHVEGMLEFIEGDDMQKITVPILRTSKTHSEDLSFQVILENPSTGVRLESEEGNLSRQTSEPRGDSERELLSSSLSKRLTKMLRASSSLSKCSSMSSNTRECACEVVLLGQRSCLNKFVINTEWWHLYFLCWREQIRESLYCGGCVAEQFNAEMSDWLFHMVSLVWKVCFALIPPPIAGVSWVTFLACLFGIGCLTSLIKDLAELLGCCFGFALWGEPLPAEVTAITLVALGTSLPDVLASKIAAESDDTADNSIGNVTGSNAVNVFLGLGVPWVIGSIYWEFAGSTSEWKARVHRGRNYQKVWGDQYPAGGLIVPADSLGFNVCVFAMAAAACLVLLMFRRWRYGGELGGPQGAQRRDSIVLFLIWVCYLTAAITKTLGLY